MKLDRASRIHRFITSLHTPLKPFLRSHIETFNWCYSQPPPLFFYGFVLHPSTEPIRVPRKIGTLRNRAREPWRLPSADHGRAPWRPLGRNKARTGVRFWVWSHGLGGALTQGFDETFCKGFSSSGLTSFNRWPSIQEVGPGAVEPSNAASKKAQAGLCKTSKQTPPEPLNEVRNISVVQRSFKGRRIRIS